MTKRTKAIEALEKYFEEKGRVLTAQEYIREEDTPIRFQQVRLMFGSWPKMEKIIMARENADNNAFSDVDDIIRQNNQRQADVEAKWKEASENQEAKAEREAEAQVVAEKLAANAATAEGANANKLAIGGPLPSEQPRFELRGATVTIDPATAERTVVDPEPEIVGPELGDEVEAGDTFEAIKRKVEAKKAAPKVGKATDGGSSGTPSVAEASALGGDEDVDADTTADRTSSTTTTTARAKPATTTSDKK